VKKAPGITLYEKTILEGKVTAGQEHKAGDNPGYFELS